MCIRLTTGLLKQREANIVRSAQLSYLATSIRQCGQDKAIVGLPLPRPRQETSAHIPQYQSGSKTIEFRVLAWRTETWRKEDANEDLKMTSPHLETIERRACNHIIKTESFHRQSAWVINHQKQQIALSTVGISPPEAPQYHRIIPWSKYSWETWSIARQVESEYSVIKQSLPMVCLD